MEEGGGDALPHAHEPWNVITALNLEPYLPAGDTWHILDLAASALLPGYAFAQVVQQLVLEISATDNLRDATYLSGVKGIDTFETNGKIYAVAAGVDADDGVQIIEITDPSDDYRRRQVHQYQLIDAVEDVDVFEIDGRPYAAVAAYTSEAVQDTQPDRT